MISILSNPTRDRRLKSYVKTACGVIWRLLKRASISDYSPLVASIILNFLLFPTLLFELSVNHFTIRLHKKSTQANDTELIRIRNPTALGGASSAAIAYILQASGLRTNDDILFNALPLIIPFFSQTITVFPSIHHLKPISFSTSSTAHNLLQLFQAIGSRTFLVHRPHLR